MLPTMQRARLLRRIAAAAAERRVSWVLVRQGARHELWVCGRTSVTIPRHREINELTALGICRTLEPELGENWWR